MTDSFFSDHPEVVQYILKHEGERKMPMNTFDIYYENADTDDPKEYRMTIQAQTMADALQLASEYLEIPAYDLVAVYSDGEPTLRRCPFCQAYHTVEQVEAGLCPLRPKH